MSRWVLPMNAAEPGPAPLAPEERRQRDRQEVVGAIVDAARAIMQECGVAALNLNEVARRVRMRPQSLDGCFPTRTAIALEHPDYVHLTFDVPVPDDEQHERAREEVREILAGSRRMVAETIAAGNIDPAISAVARAIVGSTLIALGTRIIPMPRPALPGAAIQPAVAPSHQHGFVTSRIVTTRRPAEPGAPRGVRVVRERPASARRRQLDLQNVGTGGADRPATPGLPARE